MYAEEVAEGDYSGVDQWCDMNLDWTEIEKTVEDFQQKERELSDQTRIAGKTWKGLKESAMEESYSERDWFVSTHSNS